MDILFIADPLDTFKTYKDTTFAMMREAARRGHALFACEPRQISWRSSGRVTARHVRVTLTGRQGTHDHEAHDWYEAGPEAARAVADFGAVVMRKDPPFDNEFFYATHFLGQAEREGAHVFNEPRALRDHPEKMAVMEFPQFVPPTLISREPGELRAFQAEYGDVVLKPLDGMGGMGIFRIRSDGLNLGSALELLGAGGTRTLMIQQFQPAIAEGDKRVLIIGGKPAPFVLARMPQGSEVRGNLAAGGKGIAQPLSVQNRAVAEEIGRALAPRGLLLIGLDMIGDKVTEINVTSPTCFQEITQQTGFDVAAMFVDALEAAAAK